MTLDYSFTQIHDNLRADVFFVIVPLNPAQSSRYTSLKYTGGDQCYGTGPQPEPTPFSIENRFYCDLDLPRAQLFSVAFDGASVCAFVAAFRTAAACVRPVEKPCTQLPVCERVDNEVR
jgi:hypothetical protein